MMMMMMIIIIDDVDNNNVNTKRNWKLSKHKDLEFEISRVRKVRTKIVPVRIGALGTIKKGLDQKLHLLPVHWSVIEMQKITLISTTHNIITVLG